MIEVRKDLELKKFRESSHEAKSLQQVKPVIIFDEFDVAILKCLEKETVLLQFQIGDHTGISAPNIRVHLARLLFFGYIKEDGVDQKKFYSLTLKGKSFLESEYTLLSEFVIKQHEARGTKADMRLKIKRWLHG